ncbi:hypothetical protein QTO34_017689 [Cnephaeus nilssonii]|uniref:Uncharacterized protein n=1 Tax=Cnephaeus nilssonii TaxID=3371016 RepID=A0AA40I2D4_CNENI|nr:hypothetical protein QTO34_017689 [Eptesicus nilssonii]
MDLNRIIQALKGTIDPKLRIAAENELNQVRPGPRRPPIPTPRRRPSPHRPAPAPAPRRRVRAAPPGPPEQPPHLLAASASSCPPRAVCAAPGPQQEAAGTSAGGSRVGLKSPPRGRGWENSLPVQLRVQLSCRPSPSRCCWGALPGARLSGVGRDQGRRSAGFGGAGERRGAGALDSGGRTPGHRLPKGKREDAWVGPQSSHEKHEFRSAPRRQGQLLGTALVLEL